MSSVPIRCVAGQTQQAAEDNVLRRQAKEMQGYGGALRRKLHDGQDATEEKQALQQIREKHPLISCSMIRGRTRHTLITGQTYLQSRIMKGYREPVCWEGSVQDLLLMGMPSVQLVHSAAGSALLPG